MRHTLFRLTRSYDHRRRAIRPSHAISRLRGESLESRHLLAITVDTLVDELDNSISDGDISLRDAIAAAAPGETIDFAVTGTISLNAALGQLNIGNDLVIDGPGTAQLTIDGQSNTRVLEITHGTVTIRELTLSGGRALPRGGSIFTHPGTDTFVETVVVRVSTSLEGGGIANEGAMLLSQSTLSGNSALGGGGVSNRGLLTIDSSTLSGNTASSGGGGVFSSTDASTVIVNSTLSGNSVVAFNSLGGGILNASGLTVVEHTTIAENDATQGSGGGIWNEVGASTEVYSTILAGNLGDDVASDMSGSFSSRGFNLIGLGSSISDFNVAGDILTSSGPRLTPLGNYGGPTQTHELLDASRAIDAGNPAATVSLLDQRGYLRNIGTVDIGAVESQTRRVDILDDENDGDFSTGDLSLREAIQLANTTPGANTIRVVTPGTFELALGELAITDDVSIWGRYTTIDAGGLSRAFNISSGNVQLQAFTMTGGLADKGGALYNSESADTTLTRVELLGNTASSSGGALFNQGTIALKDTLVAGNTATSGGSLFNDSTKATTKLNASTVSGNNAIEGGGIYNRGNLILGYSTVSGNSALMRGGGVFSDTQVNGLTTQIGSSTISGNSAMEGGGLHNAGGLTTVNHSTLTLNEASGQGGGISVHAADTELLSTIVAGNVASDDVSSTQVTPNPFVSLGHNLIGGGSAASAFIQLGDQVIGNADPLLDVLQNNGGPTLTHALLPGSPALNAGNPQLALAPATDQRGSTFARVIGVIDIGAFENRLELVVDTLADESDGDYSVGDLTLREALELADYASGNPRRSVITFEPALLPGRVELAQGSLGVGNMTVNGPGADLLTIDALGQSRVMTVGPGAEVSGLTLTGGNDVRGGGVLGGFVQATLSELVIHGNTAQGYGGGVAGAFTIINSEISNNVAASGGGIAIEGRTTITNSTVSGNSAASRIGAARVGGGGIHINEAAQEVTIENTAISGNVARTDDAFAVPGGGLANLGRSLAITNSTLSANSTSGEGGGLFSYGPLTETFVINSTISGNSAVDGGGMASRARDTIVEHSTITKNTAANGAGIWVPGNSFPIVYLGSSIVAGNEGTNELFSASRLDDSFTSGDYNLIGTGNALAPFSGTSDIVIGDANPKLGPLRDNGGPTHTHAPFYGSPALDNGDPLAVAGMSRVPEFDQRGLQRIVDGTGQPAPRIDIGALEAQVIVLLECDFDGDDDCDIADIDGLVGEIVSGNNNLLFDINNDQRVDLVDRDDWLEQAGAHNLASGNAYLLGDSNLDGVVNGEDFVVWNTHKFTTTGAWSQADWNADGVTDGRDFVEWNDHKFQSSVPQTTRYSLAALRHSESMLSAREPDEEWVQAIDAILGQVPYVTR